MATSCATMLHPIPLTLPLLKDRCNAQSSCAGLFIGAHLGFDYPGSWVHVDMAYPVHCGERATGYGVALLTTAFGHHSANSLLRAAAPQW